ncbi:Glycosyltransferase involved in cell wall bisynthesis [Chryseolinea serpens]|uniref:Glycosyltransferase involved in cell wall bisynthesis n=1 Tax=Chryseolinea serpens TaxID=947013 RepID=A0A1M5XNL4_9BACT|nr:glycosyltransferase family 4 protein [Chryseolinea serpens]SHI01356.1 Glycosyltransferase involved in cell wall bisynthesis [Chryseolinea serpens]
MAGADKKIAPGKGRPPNYSFLCTVKILILHQHFNTPQTGGALRSYYLAKALVAAGMTPVVITAHNEGKYKGVNVEGIEIHYLPIVYHNHFGFWRRSIAFIRYVAGVVWTTRKLGPVKTCYAISVPLTVGLAARMVKKVYGIPYIFEVGDLWPEAPIQMGFVKNYFFKQLLYGLETSTYRKAQAVVALSPMIQSEIEKKMPGKTIHLIPNMSDTDFYFPEEKQRSFEIKFGVENKFVVSYIGAVGLANGLDFFIECARASQKADLPIHFLLCGSGALLENLKAIVKRLTLTNFTFIPFQDRDGVREVMNVTDAAFVCYKPIPILETGSPNKYFDGLAAGKLILVNFGGWIRSEIEQQRCGEYVDSRQPQDFVKVITPYLEDRVALKKSQQAGRLLAETKYSRNILGRKFATLFQ